MKLSKWYQFIKPNSSFYKDGFFEFPFLANTPELMIESTIKTPGSKHDAKEQIVYRKNLFIDGTMRYRKIDDGCWLTITNIEFKHNTLIKTVYAKNIPSEHYTLTFTLYKSEIKLQNTFINKMPFQNKFWGFLKSQEQKLVLTSTKVLNVSFIFIIFTPIGLKRIYLLVN